MTKEGADSTAVSGLEERKLLERARDGDEEAFETLVLACQNRVYSLALRIVRSPQDAEDVAQEAFLRAWLGLSAFRGDSSFLTWTCSIAARRAIDRATVLRARRTREMGEEAAAGTPGSAPPDPWREASARRLWSLVDGLSPEQRAAVTLYYSEGKSTRETAAMLRVPEGTVKTHLRRARAALREGWMRREESR